MEKYLVIANFAGYDAREDDLYASQWAVGTFDTLGECFESAKEDLKQVARDYYECVLDTDDYESSAEFELAIEDKIVDYVACRWISTLTDTTQRLTMFKSDEFLTNDFTDGKYTDQRQIVKYTIYKISVDVRLA